MAAMGAMNIQARKSTPQTSAVRPVRPPASTPAADSTKVVTVEVPVQEPQMVPTASASSASFILGILPCSSTIPAREAVPTRVPIVSNISMMQNVIVSVMTVNNETGAIQPIYEIATAIENHCKGKRKPKFHTDAVQAIGKIPVDLSFKGIDCASLSAHKFYGPRGVGLLYCDYPLDSFLKGGGQEKGVRSGTENLFGIIAMTLCLEKYASKSALEENLKSEKENVDFFISEILKDKNATLIPECRSENPENYSPSVVQIAFNNIPGEVMVRTLSSKGYCISTGSACSARKMNRPILKAMGISDEKATNAVRFSFGAYTEKSHMENLIKELTEISSMFNR